MYQALFVDPWPWWWAGLAVGGFVILYAWVYNRLMGMSSTIENAFREWKDPLLPQSGAPVYDLEAAAAALMAQKEGNAPVATAVANDLQPLSDVYVFSPRLLVLGIVIGALAAGVLSGGGFLFSLGPSFEALFGSSVVTQASVLVLGGFLVGFGARMAGGCPSGHGLGGLSVFSRASLVAVAGYFIAGIPLTFLLRSLG